MKSFFFSILSAALTLGFVPAAAHSATEDAVVKTLRITKYAKGVNLPCPEGSDKMFIVKVRVHPDSLGTFADGDQGVAEIVLTNDRQLNTEDYQVPPDYSESDFFFYAPSRFAKIKKDPAENSVTVQISGPNMWFRVSSLRRDCIENFGG